MRVLVLNAGYEPLQLISWQRALCLVFSEKAEIVADYGKEVRSVSQSFRLPSVVRLTNYVRFVKRFGFVKCTRRNIFLRDSYKCQYCGIKCSSQEATLDHILPSSKGGRTTWENVVTCCAKCNRKKGNQLLHLSGMSLLRKPKRAQWRDLMKGGERVVESTWLPYLEAG